ncbi:hypothetical protein GCM10009127_21130 [Alteraurantiacibacter aestuarii]
MGYLVTTAVWRKIVHCSITHADRDQCCQGQSLLSGDGVVGTDSTDTEPTNPAWTEPLGGSVSQGVLLYVATGQWDRFAQGGRVNEGQEPVPTEIRSLPSGP